MIKRSNKKGFTLVEIIVVLVILAILAAIAVPSVLGYVEEAKKEKYIAEAHSIYTVIQVEETKLANEVDYTTVPDTFTSKEDYMFAKLCDKSYYYSVGEGIISKKTGIKSMDWIYPGKSGDDYIYKLVWTSADGNKITADLYKNKKVDIISVDKP